MQWRRVILPIALLSGQASGGVVTLTDSVVEAPAPVQGSTGRKQCAKSVVTDAKQCGSDVIKKTVKDALHCGWKPCKIGPIRTRCPKVCVKRISVPKSCEINTVCEYRVRVELAGGVSISSFQNASADFAYVRHYLVEGDPIVKNIVDATDNDEIRGVIRRLVEQQKSTVQQHIDKWKLQLVDMLTELLSKDETFGDYSFVRGFLGRSSTLVETLLPVARLSAVAENASTVTTVEIPGAETFAETTVCSQMARQRHFWWRALPFLLLTAMTAWKYPRVGLGIAIVGIVLSTGLVTNTVCTQSAPLVAARSMVSFRVPTSKEVHEMGLPSEVSFVLDFHEQALRASFAPLATVGLEQVLQSMVVHIGDADGKLPVRISGANLPLQAQDEYIALAPGSWVDFDGKLDARCAPKCGISII